MFYVYHAINPSFGRETPDFTPENYRKVAEVQVANMEDVYELTNHIMHHWWDNAEVTLVGEPKQRSTSVGDILVTSEGVAYRYDAIGFTEIPNTFA